MLADALMWEPPPLAVLAAFAVVAVAWAVPYLLLAIGRRRARSATRPAAAVAVREQTPARSSAGAGARGGMRGAA